MTNEQVKVVGTVEDVARAAYDQGFRDGYDAARLVVEVLTNEERRGGGVFGAEGILKALDMSRDKAAELRKAQQAQAQKAASGEFTIHGEGDPAIDALVKARAEAKKAKNFAEADRIRDELKAQGIEVTDMPNGASWRRI